MSTNLKLCFLVFVFIPLLAQGQVKIESNSSSGTPNLILKETEDDFSRLYFQNTNGGSNQYWSMTGKIGINDLNSHFRMYYSGLNPATSDYVFAITGERRIGIGTIDPPARLTLKQSLDQDDNGLRIMDATGNNSGRLWMNGGDFHIHKGSDLLNGFVIKSNDRIGAFTDDPQARLHIYEGTSGSDNLFLVTRNKLINNTVTLMRVLEAKEDGNTYIRKLGVYEDNPTDILHINAPLTENPFRVQISGDTKLRVLSNGGTSIGGNNTNPPANGLYVSGQTYIGTTSGTDRLQVSADAGENPLRVVINGNTKLRVLSNGGTSIGTNNTSPPSNGLYVFGDLESGNGSNIILRNNSGAQTIRLDSDISSKGRVITDELQIVGGSDISENFHVSEGTGIEPGMVVSIDTDHPGQLCITKSAMDKNIVGVISGANNINTGLIMGQKGSIADGEYPIALTGRVYVNAEALNFSIKPGDLLTSSNIPGYVMKVTKNKRASGAIIGKALSSLDSDTGQVLILINLQ